MKLNRYIDHTLLAPFATAQQVKSLCQEAIDYSFYAVCVSPYFARLAQKLLVNSDIKVSTVIAFPYGYESTSSKVACMEATVAAIDEYDVVVNLQAVMNEDWTLVQNEIITLTRQAHQQKKIIKWIVESGNISENYLLRLCEICNEANVDYMKTSTGMLGTGATLSAVNFMRAHLNNHISIKASGGIRDRQTALSYIEAGASRIGASRGVEMVTDSPESIDQ